MGTYGNGDNKDVSHVNGGVKLESQSTNRGRKEKSRMKGSKRKAKNGGDVTDIVKGLGNVRRQKAEMSAMTAPPTQLERYGEPEPEPEVISAGIPDWMTNIAMGGAGKGISALKALTKSMGKKELTTKMAKSFAKKNIPSALPLQGIEEGRVDKKIKEGGKIMSSIRKYEEGDKIAPAIGKGLKKKKNQSLLPKPKNKRLIERPRVPMEGPGAGLMSRPDAMAGKGVKEVMSPEMMQLLNSNLMKGGPKGSMKGAMMENSGKIMKNGGDVPWKGITGASKQRESVDEKVRKLKKKHGGEDQKTGEPSAITKAKKYEEDYLDKKTEAARKDARKKVTPKTHQVGSSEYKKMKAKEKQAKQIKEFQPSADVGTYKKKKKGSKDAGDKSSIESGIDTLKKFTGTGVDAFKEFVDPRNYGVGVAIDTVKKLSKKKDKKVTVQDLPISAAEKFRLKTKGKGVTFKEGLKDVHGKLIETPEGEKTKYYKETYGDKKKSKSSRDLARTIKGDDPASVKAYQASAMGMKEGDAGFGTLGPKTLASLRNIQGKKLSTKEEKIVTKKLGPDQKPKTRMETAKELAKKPLAKKMELRPSKEKPTKGRKFDPKTGEKITDKIAKRRQAKNLRNQAKRLSKGKKTYNPETGEEIKNVGDIIKQKTPKVKTTEKKEPKLKLKKVKVKGVKELKKESLLSRAKKKLGKFKKSIKGLKDKKNLPSGQFAEGGMLSGPSHKRGGIAANVGNQPIEMEGGEFVIKKSSAKKLGEDLLHYMNKTGKVPKFLAGGYTSKLYQDGGMTPEKADEMGKLGDNRTGLTPVYEHGGCVTMSGEASAGDVANTHTHSGYKAGE